MLHNMWVPWNLMSSFLKDTSFREGETKNGGALGMSVLMHHGHQAPKYGPRCRRSESIWLQEWSQAFEHYSKSAHIHCNQKPIPHPQAHPTPTIPSHSHEPIPLPQTHSIPTYTPTHVHKEWHFEPVLPLPRKYYSIYCFLIFKHVQLYLSNERKRLLMCKNLLQWEDISPIVFSPLSCHSNPHSLTKIHPHHHPTNTWLLPNQHRT